jgi:hypothetical protein
MRKPIKEENPVMANEWDCDKNIGLDPDKFTGGSNKVVWWKCKLGHSWQSQINKRFSRGDGCPYCSGQKVWPGFNDLKTTHPHIAKQWDYKKNGKLRPEQFSVGADIKLWWKCKKCNQSWNAVLYSRKNCGCPACAGNILKFGVNDLQTVNPRLAQEWDVARNNSTPDSLAANSNKKVWWKCKHGHSWQATVACRNRGNGCPYCANRKLLPGFNDLLSVAPKLAAEWNYKKNGSLRPQDVLAGSHKVVWWICPYGHEWQTKILHRLRGHGCPYDAGKLVMPGETDLKTRHPNICKEWDYEKNKNISPDAIACHSNKRFWWRCSKGHSYQSTASNRVSGKGCPYCAGKRPIVGETDFGSVHPELICEWDIEKNGNLRPEHITAASHKKVWWKCKEGHSWKAAAYYRHAGNNCPRCGQLKDKHIVVIGENDFATIHPDIADEWDYERNGDLRPQDVLPNSNRIVWWVCKRGHHWKTKVQARVKGTICPHCKGKTPMRTRLI